VVFLWSGCGGLCGKGGLQKDSFEGPKIRHFLKIYFWGLLISEMTDNGKSNELNSRREIAVEKRVSPLRRQSAPPSVEMTINDPWGFGDDGKVRRLRSK
jgi:hypothetical protein